jgi:hypothetical protein
MNAIFVVSKSIGDGKSSLSARRPWFDGKCEWIGMQSFTFYICNVFAKDQSVLDTIAADPRTEFYFPIDVDGAELDYGDEIEVHPSMRGKIIAWCAQTYGAEFGQWVSTNAKNRRFVAREIMSKVSGILNVDPLNGFRVYWSE